MAVKFDLPFTQNSTIVAFICTLLVAIAVSPIGRMELGRAELTTTLIRLTHLTSFASWFGVQVWVTFFAGKTLYSLVVQSHCLVKYAILVN